MNRKQRRAEQKRQRQQASPEAKQARDRMAQAATATPQQVQKMSGQERMEGLMVALQQLCARFAAGHPQGIELSLNALLSTAVVQAILLEEDEDVLAARVKTFHQQALKTVAEAENRIVAPPSASLVGPDGMPVQASAPVDPGPREAAPNVPDVPVMRDQDLERTFRAFDTCSAWTVEGIELVDGHVEVSFEEVNLTLVIWDDRGGNNRHVSAVDNGAALASGERIAGFDLEPQQATLMFHLKFVSGNRQSFCFHGSAEQDGPGFDMRAEIARPAAEVAQPFAVAP